jgi:hypothetical protein
MEKLYTILSSGRLVLFAHFDKRWKGGWGGRLPNMKGEMLISTVDAGLGERKVQKAAIPGPARRGSRAKTAPKAPTSQQVTTHGLPGGG